MRSWRRAWQEALYGEGGFYRRPAGPAGHFATSCHGAQGALFAAALVRLADREGLETIVDVGAGRGELIGHLHRAAASAGRGVRLVGADIVRAEALPAGVEWRLTTGGATPPDLRGLGRVLVIANEWLDVVPCVVAEADAAGRLREVLVAPDGTEASGAPVGEEDLAWSRRWWPAVAPGDRVEIGRSRDEALRALVHGVDAGVVVAIDYGHRLGERPVAGSLTGYRGGIQVPPTPDGGCDLTAHVAVDSLPHDRVLTQREALRELGLGGELRARGGRAAYEMARTDPHGYLVALQRDAAIGALCGPGLGDFWWVVNRVG